MLWGHHWVIRQRIIAAATNPETSQKFQIQICFKKVDVFHSSQISNQIFLRCFFPQVSQLETSFLSSFFLFNHMAKLLLRTNSANLSFLSKYTKDLVIGRKPFLFHFGILNAGFTIRNYSGQLSPHPAQIFGVLDEAAT